MIKSPTPLAEQTDAELAEALHDRSGGNPFFLTQFVKLLTLDELEGVSENAIDPGIALPRGLREAIARQIAGLPASTQRVLAAAAVNGREFSLTELAAALSLPIEELLAAIAPALESQLVREIDGRPRSYRFDHVLLRHALYEGIEPAERSALHRRIGEAIETTLGSYSAADDLAKVESLVTDAVETAPYSSCVA